MRQTYEGGCHCGQVRFRVQGDLADASDCNCSICTMKGFLHLVVPREQFELLLIDTEAALAAIPSLLPEDAGTREKAFDLVCQVLRARGEYSDEDRARIERLARLSRVDGQSHPVRSLAAAAGDFELPRAKAS